MNSHTVLTVAVVLLLIGGCIDSESGHKGPHSNSPISRGNFAEAEHLLDTIFSGKASLDELKEVFSLRDRDEMYTGVNAMVRYRSVDGVREILQDAWALKKEQHPGFNWPVVSQPLVRIALAQVLAQIDEVNFHAYYVFLDQQLHNHDERIRGAAVGAIGIIGGEKEISRLESIIQQDTVYVAGYAIGALAAMAFESADARAALNRLSQAQTVNQEKKKIIDRVKRNQRLSP